MLVKRYERQRIGLVTPQNFAIIDIDFVGKRKDRLTMVDHLAREFRKGKAGEQEIPAGREHRLDQLQKIHKIFAINVCEHRKRIGNIEIVLVFLFDLRERFTELIPDELVIMVVSAFD